MKQGARSLVVAVALALGLGALPAGGAVPADAPIRWDAVGGAAARLNARAAITAVSSAGATGSGIVTAVTGAGPQFAALTVQGTSSSVGQRVRLRMRDAGGEIASSAPVVLQPWAQTVGVSGVAGGSLVLALLEEGEGWQAGDDYHVSGTSVTAQGPTVTSTSGRQLLVDGDPYTMRGYVYFPTAPGDLPWVRHWNHHPQQCQSDAQLMRAAGVNTLRIWYLETSYDEQSYRQCADAFYAAGIMLMWLVQPPGGLQTHQPHDPELAADAAYIEAYWAHLELAVQRLQDHPATLGWNIGNEMSRTNPGSNGWYAQVDVLAGRTKAIDPLHVTTTALSANQHLRDVSPTVAPNIDLWGINRYGWPAAWAQDTIATDPTRPVWISEFGRPRYTCFLHPAGFGLQLAADQLGCSEARGSGENVPLQRGSLDAAWSAISAHLTEHDPAGAVVGGTLFMWADLWWFACCVVTGIGTPHTRDVSNAPNIETYQQNSHFPVEWYGTTLAMAAGADGPRITTPNYDFMAQHYTGAAPPTVSNVQVTPGACSAEVSWTTNVPTFGRADFGLEHKVTTGAGTILSENFIGDGFTQDDTLRTTHSAELDGLLPAQSYLVYVRGFDTDGRAGTSGTVQFTTTADLC